MGHSIWQRLQIWSCAVAVAAQMVVAAALSPSHALPFAAVAEKHVASGHIGEADRAPDHDMLDPACQLWWISQANCGSATSLPPPQGQWQPLARAESRAMMLRSDDKSPSDAIALEPPPPRLG